jgi:hypothetical protein
MIYRILPFDPMMNNLSRKEVSLRCPVYRSWRWKLDSITQQESHFRISDPKEET